jgi:hypothetical protein
MSAQFKGKVIEVCVEIHVTMKRIAEEFYQEYSRRCYTTPTLYLGLVNLCISFPYLCMCVCSFFFGFFFF